MDHSRVSLALSPVQLRTSECRFRLGIGNRIGHIAAPESPQTGKFLPPPLCDELAELIVVIGEKEKRGRSQKLLTHKEQNRLGQEQEQRRRGGIAVTIDIVMQALTERLIADLIVVLDAEHETARRFICHPRVPGPAAKAAD